MTRPLVVQKYGGSSVADVASLQRVADRVVERKKQGYDVVVVVSAMGDSTDDLLALASQVTENPSRRELDMLLTAGERISMSLLSMAIQQRGWEAISFTGSQSGILTNARHVDARIIEVRPVRIQDELELGRIVIVAGFQGMSYKREVTTLGRGGSDTTAIALAAALDAESCEIYSDVDGVYNADPRAVPSAERIEEIDYETMEELARTGARVLHAEAVAFARKHQIALLARATRGGRGQTLVRKDLPEYAGQPVYGISCLSSLHRVCFASISSESALWERWKNAGVTPTFVLKQNKDVDSFFSEDGNPGLEQVVDLWSQEESLRCSVMACSALSVVGAEVVGRMDWLQHISATLEQIPSASVVAMEKTPMRCTWFFHGEHAIEAQAQVAALLASLVRDA